MRLKKKDFEGKLVSKYVTEILRHFGYEYLKEDIDFFLFQKLKELLET